MEIFIADDYQKSKCKEVDLQDEIIFVKVTEYEAIALINSLSNQLIKKDCNSNKLESFDSKGNMFSIAVSLDG